MPRRVAVPARILHGVVDRRPRLPLRLIGPSLLALIVGVGALFGAAAPAADPPPPCGPQHPSEFRLIAPTEVPWRFLTGVAVARKGDERGAYEPAVRSARIDPLEGGQLRPGYAGTELNHSVGMRHYWVYGVRFLRGDTGGRVTVTYEESHETSETYEICTRKLTADIRALPDHGVRVRIRSIRQRGRRLIVNGRLSRRARRPVLVVVDVSNQSGGSSQLRKRFRARGRRFRATISLRGYDGTSLPLRVHRARGYYPGDFRDPAPRYFQ